MKKRILVTGGTGYIGSHTVVELQESGYEVVIVDNLSNSSADVVDHIEQVTGIRPIFEKLDCLDFDGLDRLFAKYLGRTPQDEIMNVQIERAKTLLRHPVNVHHRLGVAHFPGNDDGFRLKIIR